MVKRISLGHVSVDEYTPAHLRDRLLRLGFHGDKTHLVVTLNAQFYVCASKNTVFQECLKRAEYLCADGHSMLLACRWLSGNALERIPGVELMQDLCKEGASQGLRVALLGGRPGAAEDTARILKDTYQGLQIVGVFCPDHGFEEDPASLQALLTDLKSARPHMVFVGLGVPKQELFIDQHLRKLKIPVAIGVGGSFEMISGRVKRAPLWMHDAGLEWLFRLVQEPRRLWRRYCIGNLEFLAIVFATYCRQQLERRRGLLSGKGGAQGTVNDTAHLPIDVEAS